MNKKPVSFLQVDPAWKDIRLPVGSGTMSIGGAGCGPTSAAMLISTLTGRTYSPIGTFKWCCEHGYMYLNQGTAYTYFEPQFEAFGIRCKMLPGANYGQTHYPNRTTVEKMLKEGYYFIALMKKGLWTSGGHYVVAWWADDKIRINDPASTRYERLNGDPDTFFSQAKYFWAIDARDHNEEDDMTQERFNQLMDGYLKELAEKEPSAWSEEARQWAEQNGLINGDAAGNKQYRSFLTREQMAVILKRFAEKK